MNQLHTSNMLFVVGRGRSGTTLLTRILSSHPEIFIPEREGLFIENLYGRYKNKTFNKKDIKPFVRDIMLEQRMQLWPKNLPLLIEQLESSVDNDNFASLSKKFYYYCAQQNKGTVKWLGDKNPHYALTIPFLKKLYPKAKFIGVTRECKDNILSFKKVDFDINNTAGLAYRWKVFNTQIVRHFHDADPDQFLKIRYEDLAADTEQQLKQICKFLDIDFHEDMLSFFKNANDLGYAWHKNLNKPISTENVNKWKEEMPAKDVAIADSITRSVAKPLGYAVDAGTTQKRYPFAIAWGTLLGWLFTFIEKNFHKIPLILRSWLFKLYRIKSKAA